MISLLFANDKQSNPSLALPPFLYKNQFDMSAPGYGYCNSDLKSPYLSRQQLNSRMISPSITLENNM